MSNSIRRWILRIHKWIGICLGVVIFVWLVSGVVMILPPASTPPKGRQRVEYTRAALSPAQAIELVASRERDSGAVRRVTLVPVLERDYYLLETSSRQSYLLDSETGDPFVIDTGVAERIARQAAGGRADAATVETVNQPVSGYMAGPLPVFRVAFDDSRGTVVFVSPRDGAARYTDRLMRTRFFLAGLHTFDQLRLMPVGKDIRKPLLYLTSLVGFGLVLTGYYMVFPKRWRLKE